MQATKIKCSLCNKWVHTFTDEDSTQEFRNIIPEIQSYIQCTDCVRGTKKVIETFNNIVKKKRLEPL